MKLLRARTDDLHCADNFMTRNNAFAQCKQFAIYDVQIGAANAARGNAHQQLSRARLTGIAVYKPQRYARGGKLHCAHDGILG